MTAPLHRLQFGQHTHPGPRDSNQDTVLSVELPDGRQLVAVADGMGGLAEGERAGRAALAALYRSLSEGNDLRQGIRDANAAVLQESSDLPSGTTVVAALISGHRAEIVNIGDSRAYHCDRLGLLQITRDHTMGEEAARNGSARAVQTAPDRWAGALARYLGAKETVEADTFGPMVLEEGDWLLLCSDGLHRVLDKEDMEAQLKGEADPNLTAGKLVEMALARNTDDNVSVALVYRPEVNEVDDLGNGADQRFPVPAPADDESANPGDVWWTTGPGGGTTEPMGVELQPDAKEDMLGGQLQEMAPISSIPSSWDPEKIFARSPRNGGKRKGALVTTVVVVGVLAVLVLAFMALNRAMSP